MRTLWILSILTSIIISKEIFLYEPHLEIASMSKTQEYCQKVFESIQMCYTKSITYPLCIENKECKLKEFIELVDKKYLNSYNKNSASDTVKEMIESYSDVEPEDIVSRIWSSDTELSLFSTTPKSVTFMVNSSAFTGGAHGSYTTVFENYNTDTKRVVNIDSIIKKDSKKELLQIAQKYYKLTFNLPLSQPLTKSNGWLNDNFVLADSFAVTPVGLYFVYNQYEIKPYAYGQTRFLLPYGAFKDLINPKSILAFATKFITYEYRYTDEASNDNSVSDSLQTTLRVEKISDSRYRLDFNIYYGNFAKRGYLTVRLPQIESKKSIKVLNKEGVTIYPVGSKIYNKATHKNIRSKYLIVEKELKSIGFKNPNRTLSLYIDIPQKKKYLIVDFRTVLIDSNKKMLEFPNEDEGEYTGEQGFANHRAVIPL